MDIAELEMAAVVCYGVVLVGGAIGLLEWPFIAADPGFYQNEKWR
jgi:hypothetical protein